MTEIQTRPVMNIEPIIGPGQKNKFELTEKTPWYKRILCRLGIHSGVWSFLIEANCRQLRVCTRCGKTQQRIKHDRVWVYIKQGSCEQVKTCLRCDEKGKQRTKHTWGSTYSVGNDNAHDCSRCRKHETWAKYDYDD